MSHILIVEDNEMNRDMLSRRLIRKGFEVTMAFDGKLGVEAAKKTLPGLILMDINMPVMDGYEATEILKACEATKKIPIIALTAYALEEDEETAKSFGCDGYLPKPIDFELLLNLMGTFGIKH